MSALLLLAALLASPAPVHPVAASASLLPSLRATSGGDSTALARRFWLQAMERMAVLEEDSAVVLLRRATDADPDFLPAHLPALTGRQDRPDRLAYAEYVRRSGGKYAECVATVAERITPEFRGDGARGLVERMGADGPDPCEALFIALWGGQLTPVGVWDETRLAYADSLTRWLPDLAQSWLLAAGLRRGGETWGEALALYREGLSHMRHAVDRVAFYRQIGDTWREKGDTARALDVYRGLAAALARDGRPGLRQQFPVDPDQWVGASPVGADTLWKQARMRVAREAGSLRLQREVHQNSAWTFMNAGIGDPLRDHFDPLVEFARRLGSLYMLQVGLQSRGRALMKMGRYEEAERDLFEALAANRIEGDPYALPEIHHQLSHLYEAQERWYEAIRYSDLFVETARVLVDSPTRTVSLLDAVKIYEKAGQRGAARARGEELLQVVEQQNMERVWAGDYLEQRGRYEEALEQYGLGLETDGWEQRPLNLAGMTRMLLALGQVDSAEVIARLHERTLLTHLDVPSLPLVLAEQGRLEEATALAREWAERRVRGGQLESAARSLNQVAELLLRQGRFEEARAEAERSRTLAATGYLLWEQAHAERLEGLALEGLGRQEDAVGLLRTAAARADARGVADVVLLSHLSLADVLARSGSADEALREYDRAATVVESSTSTLRSDVDRARFRDRQLEPFDGALRVLLDDVGRADERLELFARWSQRRKAGALVSGQAPGPTRGNGRGSLSGVVQLQRRLGEDEAVLDYTVLDDRVAVLALRREHAELMELDVSPDSVAHWVDRLHRPLATAFAGRVDVARAPFSVSTAARLHEALVAPLEARLEGVRELVVVPDGPLHLLPFDALVTDGGIGSSPTYLIDRFVVSVLPTLRLLPKRDPVGPGGLVGRVLAVHTDAPGGVAETEAVRRAWGGRAVILGGEEATESAVGTRGRDHDVLHFATHAVADQLDPLASHLRLHADSASNGLLEPVEIYAAGLAARLVILSACETLTGPNLRGEGLIGLARAFLEGGAESVVGTHWPIGAQAASLMGRFHEELAGGSPVPEALHAAKRAVQQDPATSHPFYWAGFTLVRGG